MPNMQLTPKKWGKADRAALARLVHDRDMDINDLSYDNINAFERENFATARRRIFVSFSMTLQPHSILRLNIAEQRGEGR